MEGEHIVVEGEEFVVTTGDAPGRYHYDWVSGPNAGYGFSVAVSDGSPLRDAQHVALIRDFLAAVDPATGYIGDQGATP